MLMNSSELVYYPINNLDNWLSLLILFFSKIRESYMIPCISVIIMFCFLIHFIQTGQHKNVIWKPHLGDSDVHYSAISHILCTKKLIEKTITSIINDRNNCLLQTMTITTCMSLVLKCRWNEHHLMCLMRKHLEIVHLIQRMESNEKGWQLQVSNGFKNPF